jgi:hypothetical protein
VTNIGNAVFAHCNSLQGVYFRGNAPVVGSSEFFADTNAIVYYLPGTTGWSGTFGGLPTMLWLPQIQVNDISFGVQTNQFGFNYNWASGTIVVVEACTNLTNLGWQPIQTNMLNSSSCYFSDPQWTNYPERFYRLR